MSESNVEPDEYTKTLIGVKAQKRFLLKLIEEDEPGMSRKQFSTQRWEELTTELNQLGGVSKSSLQWQRTYSYIARKLKNEKLKSCTEKNMNSQSNLHKTDTEGQMFNTCRDSHQNIKRFREGGKSCMQIILQVAKRIVSAQKTDKDCLIELCKGKSTNCKRIPIWQKMRNITIMKLNYLLNAQDKITSLAAPARLTMREWLLVDTVIVHQDVTVIGMIGNTMVDMPILWNLFYLVNAFNVENLSGDTLAEAWSAVAVAYNKKNRLCSPMLLQRRWYQMKEATKSNFIKLNQDLNIATNYSPTSLQMAIAAKYKSLFTGEFVVWEDLIKQKRVILRNQLEHIGLNTTEEETGKPSNRKITAKETISHTDDDVENSSEEKDTTISLIDSESEKEDNALEKENNQKDVDKKASNEGQILPDLLEPVSNVPTILPNMPGTPLFIIPNVQYMNLPVANSLVLPGVSKSVLPGVSNPVLPGVSKPVLPGASNPVLSGASNPVLPGVSNPVLPGVSNPVLPGVTNPVLPSTSNLVLPGVRDSGVLPNIGIPVPMTPKYPNILFNILSQSKMNCNHSIPHIGEVDLTIGTECQTEIKNEPDGDDIDSDNLNLLDNGIELNDDDSPDTNVMETIGHSERDLEEETSKKQHRNLSFLENLTKVPVVYTVKLEDMNLLPPNFTMITNNKKILEKVYKKSKPILMHRKPKRTSSKYIYEKLSISSALFKKPYYRSYDSTKLFNNPDFNISLLDLKPTFFTIPRNRTLFKSCKPMTVDISKEFEKSLVNGIMYLKDDGINDSSDTRTSDDIPTSSLKLNELKVKLMKDVNEMICERDNNNFDQATSICTVTAKAKSSSSLMDTNISTYLQKFEASTKTIKKPIFKLNTPQNYISQRKKSTKSVVDNIVKTFRSIAPKQTNDVTDKIKPINNAGYMVMSDAQGSSVSKPKEQFPNNVPVPPQRTSVDITDLNQLPPDPKSEDIVTEKPTKRKKPNENTVNKTQTINAAQVISLLPPIPNLNNNVMAATSNDQSLKQDQTTHSPNASPNKGGKQSLNLVKNPQIDTKKSTITNDTEETLPADTLNADIKKTGYSNIFEYALAYLSTCPDKATKLSPERYFKCLYSGHDHRLDINNNELILTTTKLPLNFTEFLEFRRRVWRELKLPAGLQIDIEPNGRVNLYSYQGVVISNELLVKLIELVHEFYLKTGITIEPQKNNSQNIDLQKETAVTEINNKNIYKENITRQDDIHLSKNERASTVTENSIVNNSQSEHQSQKNVLDAKVKSKLGSIAVNLLTPVSQLSVLYYAYYRNGLFFKLNLETGLLRPVQLNIINSPIDEQGHDTALRSTDDSKATETNPSVPQNLGYFECLPNSVFFNDETDNSKINQNNTRCQIRIKPLEDSVSNICINNSVEPPPPLEVENTLVEDACNIPAVNLADSLFEIKEELMLEE